MRYRKLAKKMHPDKNGGTEEAKKRPAALVRRPRCITVFWDRIKVPALGPAGWEVSRDEGKVRSIEKAAGRGLPPGA